MSQERKRKIILVQGLDESFCMSCGQNSDFITAVGNSWDEVTEEEYRILQNMQYIKGFRIIERNPIITPHVKDPLRTPADYIKWWNDEEAKRKKLNEDRKKEAEARKAGKDKASIERRRKQFEKLKQEFGDE